MSWSSSWPARGAKRDGAYRVLSQASALKLTLTDSFRVSPFVGFDHHRIRGVAGPRRPQSWRRWAKAGVEIKYRALDRQAAPFGLTFVATPYWATRRRDQRRTTAPTTARNSPMMADKELIADKLLAAVNLGYTPEANRSHVTRACGGHEFGFTASAAL